MATSPQISSFGIQLAGSREVIFLRPVMIKMAVGIDRQRVKVVYLEGLEPSTLGFEEISYLIS